MNCAYHLRNPAAVQCSRCARPLCPACDHRIRGFPFCQDCIVVGVETLQQQERASLSTSVVRRKSSPFVATLLSIVPGLGAAYNGQTAKAIVHFAVFASFFQMAVVTSGVPLFFILGIIGTLLYAAVDACRTAQLMRAGFTPDAEDDVIARRLSGNPLAWSATLIILGTIFLLHTLFGVEFPVRQFLPVALIALGAYMFSDYIRRRSGRSDNERPSFDAHRPPPSVVSAPLMQPNFRTGELVTQVTARDPQPFRYDSRS
jgi:TM2 domain-containing membrane protein YozV